LRSSELRVAILPVQSLGRDGFAAGLAESLILALSKFHRIGCIDATRSSVNLDADYRLATTVQYLDSRIRIFLHLVDQHERVVWSQRWDRELDDVFALQNEIASRVAAQIDSILRLDSIPKQPTAANFVRLSQPFIAFIRPLFMKPEMRSPRP
jgi:TolB-like protein